MSSSYKAEIISLLSFKYILRTKIKKKDEEFPKLKSIQNSIEF
jgi:hypothetical protein